MATIAEQPYYFDPDFENALTWKCITSPGFFGRIGVHIDPDLLGQPHAKLLVRAAHIVNTTTGRGPASATIAIQRLSALSNDGKLALPDLAAVKAWVAKYKNDPDSAAVDEDSIVQEVVPLLQKRMKHAAARLMFDRVGKGGDTRKVQEALAAAETIGVNDKSIGVKLGRASFDQVRQLRALQKLKTGIADLDFHVGGLTLGHFGVIIGGPGDGKSMGLIHMAAAAMREGYLVAYATLELDEAIVLSRLMANLTGIPIDSVMGAAAERAESKVAELQENGQIGGFIVKYFTPQATTVDDIKEWVGSIKAEFKRAPDLLVIDYVDKMGAPRSDSEYLGMRDVCEGLRIYGRELSMPVWTASQAKAKGKDHKQLGLYSAADSLHKVRVADLVLTFNVTDDRKEIKIFVAKNRVGEAGQIVGPLPTAFALGRIVNIPTPGIDYAKTRKRVALSQVDMSVASDVLDAITAAPATQDAPALPRLAPAPQVDPPAQPTREVQTPTDITPATTPEPTAARPSTQRKGSPPKEAQKANPVPSRARPQDLRAELSGGWRTGDEDLAFPTVAVCEVCRKTAIVEERFCAKHAPMHANP